MVRHHLLSSGCVAEQLIREMSSVMYVPLLSALTGALRETGHPALLLRFGKLNLTLHGTRILVSFNHF